MIKNILRKLNYISAMLTNRRYIKFLRNKGVQIGSISTLRR